MKKSQTQNRQDISAKDAQIEALEHKVYEMNEDIQKDNQFYNREIESLRVEKRALMDQ